MKIVGLITEYNPFHKGHEYHIKEALRITGADKAIVVMSGDFVQRGTPAIMPKHLRTRMALASGVSLVLELPVRYATGSAEYFATGAVDLLNQLGCVDYLCFGSECGDISDLTHIASILLDEPDDFKKLLASHLKSGISFPKARELAFTEYSQDNNINSNILAEPNNILGIEYIKALLKLNSNIIPYTIKRDTNHYHDEELGTIHSSATSIRKIIEQNDGYFARNIKFHLSDTFTSEINDHKNIAGNNSDNTLSVLAQQLPLYSLNTLEENYGKRYPLNIQDFSLLLHHRLLQHTSTSLEQYFDITKEIANRIMKYRNQFNNVEQFIELIQSKNLTRSRVSRCLLHILLEIPDYKADISHIRNHYARVLGFSKNDTDLLTEISRCSNIPIITKIGQSESSLDELGTLLLNEDINSSNLYELVVSHKFNKTHIPEQQKTMIMYRPPKVRPKI